LTIEESDLNGHAFAEAAHSASIYPQGTQGIDHDGAHHTHCSIFINWYLCCEQLVSVSLVADKNPSSDPRKGPLIRTESDVEVSSIRPDSLVENDFEDFTRGATEGQDSLAYSEPISTHYLSM
jgi:hypothetical protein